MRNFFSELSVGELCTVISLGSISLGVSPAISLFLSGIHPFHSTSYHTSAMPEKVNNNAR